MPFALSLDSCTRLAQPQALGLAMHGLTKLLRLEQTDLTPDRPHPPCGFGADVLFGLSLSQCPDECGSCHHPPSRPASGGGLIWLMQGARVELGGGDRTHCGIRLREKVTWAETRNLLLSEPCCWPRGEMVWEWMSRRLLGKDAWFMNQNRLPCLGQLLLPPSSPRFFCLRPTA